MEERLLIWNVAANILNKRLNSRKGVVLQLGGWAWGWQILTLETGFVTKHEHVPWSWTDTYELSNAEGA